MSQPQKTGSLDRMVAGAQSVKNGTAAPAEAYAKALAPGLTAAHFTVGELKALRDICRDADNDVHAKRILADALARAEGGQVSGSDPRPKL